VLARPLLEGDVRIKHLAQVQRKRELPTRVIQAMGSFMMGQFGRAIRADRPPGPPRLVLWLLRAPILSRLFARLIAFGVRRVRLER